MRRVETCSWFTSSRRSDWRGLARAGRSMIWGLEEFHERCQSDSIDFDTVAVCGCVAEPVRTEQPVSGNSYVDLDYGGWTHGGVCATALCAAAGAACASAAAHGDAGGAAGCDRGAISGRPATVLAHCGCESGDAG